MSTHTSVEDFLKSLSIGDGKERIKVVPFGGKYDHLINHIKSGEHVKYVEGLDKLTLDSTNPKERLCLLSLLIETLATFNDNFDSFIFMSITTSTLRCWASYYDKDDLSGVVGDLISYVGCDVKSLKVIVPLFDEITPVEILSSQFGNSNGLEFDIMYDRIIYLFGKKGFSPSDVKLLVAEAKTVKDVKAFEWIKYRLVPVTFVSKRPEWVNLKKSEILVDEKSLEYGKWKEMKHVLQFNPNGVTKYIEDSFLKNAEFLNKDKEKVDSSYIKAIADIALKIDDSLDITKYPLKVRRYLGPVNKRSVECISAVVKGGCRMLTCRCRDFSEDGDDDINKEMTNPDGWFDGWCDCCMKRIPDISQTLRSPILGGGWIGSYCTMDCARQDRPHQKTSMDAMLRDMIFDNLLIDGIMDRIQYQKRRKMESSKTDSEKGKLSTIVKKK